MTTKEKKAEKAFDITVEIFKVILEEQCYSKQQIETDGLAEMAEHTNEFGKIQEIILKNIK